MLYYEKKEGKSPVVVFIHGLAGSSGSFKKQSKAIRNAQVLIDLRGQGKSERPVGKENYTPEKMLDDVKAVIRKEKLKDFVLVGFSLGSYLAMQIRHRGKTILINPVFGKDSLKRSFIAKLLVSRLVPSWLLKLFIRSPDLSEYRGLLDLYAKLLIRTPFYVYWSIVQNLKPVHPVKKCIIIRSTNDEIVKGEKGDYFIKGHHYVIAENYREVNKVLKFLIK